MAHGHPYLLDPVEPLYFGLSPPVVCPDRDRLARDVDVLRITPIISPLDPLDFGLLSPPIHPEGESLPVNNNETGYHHVLHPANTSLKSLSSEMDFGIPQSSPIIDNRAPDMTPTFTSGVVSQQREHYVQRNMSPTLPSVINHQFSMKYRNEELAVSNSSGAPLGTHITSGSPQYADSDLSSPSHHLPHKPSPSHAWPFDLEDPRRSLSDTELLKMCHSMRLGVLSEDECAISRFHYPTVKYARSLLTELSVGDSEHDIAPHILQDIIEAERPLHVAYSQATTKFRKRVGDVQRAVRLHSHTQQLRDQVQAMLDAADKMQHLFK
ncbi:hypothetical protein BDR07DRAFT_1374418 [Suillus spraguei]|nr:hypothetical protein BDR07DRAFT_1374418 [Suillus spraguei]